MPSALTLSLLAAATLAAPLAAPAQQAAPVTLSADLPAAVHTALDKGPRNPAAPVSGMILLRRPADRQAALDQAVADLSNPASPHFHHWLTPAQIGSLYGPEPTNATRIATWLSAQGFAVQPVSPDGMVLGFRGTVAQANAAFHVAIHNLVVRNEAHFSATVAPQVPAELAPAIDHVIAFNDLNPRHRSTTQDHPEGVVTGNGTTTEFLSPADLATIYDFKPLFAAGITGRGVTIAILEPNDQSSLGDWQIFRKVFGLSRAYPFGSLTEIHPAGSYSCPDPGPDTTSTIPGNEEAIDVDAATMSAPNATLLSAACPNQNGITGGLFALANLTQSSNPPSIASLSFGGDEPDAATSGSAAFSNMLFQEAAARNISVYVSSGDEGAGAYRTGVTPFGLRINNNAGSAWVTAVGATDTGVTALHQDHSTYFSSTNQANYGTALSYIPEIPWNATCASSVRAALNGYSTTGPNSFCNTRPADATFPLDATGGGPSTCATGQPSIPHVVSGSCQGTPKPAWQSLVGVPADGVRDVPDVSIFGANPVFGLAFHICNSAGNGCTGAPSTWNLGDGTSIAAPLWAGIQALINQATGSAWGLSNPQLYALARSAYGTNGNSACNSSLGNQISPSCVFHDVTLGDNTVPCTGSRDCYNTGGTYGVLSTSTSSLQPAYPAQTGYDFASGIGTPDVTNLVRAWQAAFPTAPTN